MSRPFLLILNNRTEFLLHYLLGDGVGIRSKSSLVVFSLVSLFAETDATTQVFFSPKGECESEVVEAIRQSKSKIDIAVYSLNNAAILAALENAKIRGVKIRILTDNTQAGVNADETLDLVKKGFDLRVHSSAKIMHHKFAIFDLKKAVTGSFNWTGTAQKINEENCLFTDDASAVEAYDERFSAHLWKKNTAEKSSKKLVKLKERFILKARAARNSVDEN